MSKIIAFLVVIAIAIGGFIYLNPGEEAAPVETEVVTESPVVDTMPADDIQEINYLLSGELVDVTDGEEVRGIKTLANTSGFVRTGFAGDTFIVDAEFKSLPDPRGNDFYEGWIVRRGEEMSVISTGRLEKEDGLNYTNIFTSSEDLLDHDFYVLTLEPDDDDPAPADHILEGTLQQI